MGMKISKKISKKNNKNNKHGTLKENQELLNKFGVPENSKFRNDMLGILAANSDKMFMRKFNKWYSSSPEIYLNHSSKYMVNFFMYCLERFRSINPDYYYSLKYNKIILDEPSEESTEKINAVPKNPTEAEKKEISELKDEAAQLKKIEETADDIEDKKSKHEKTLKELSDKLEESQDEQREELNKKLNEKKEKENRPKQRINRIKITQFKNEDNQKNSSKNEEIKELPEFKTLQESKSKIINSEYLKDLNKKEEKEVPPAPKRKQKIKIEKINVNEPSEEPKEPKHEIINKKEEKEVPKEEEKKAEPETKPEVKLTKSIEDLINDYQKQRPNLFAGSIRKDMFNNLLNIIIHDGNYSKLLTQIRKKHEYYEKHPKKTIEAIQKIMNETLLKDPNIQFDLFGKQLDDYVKMNFPEEFEKGDKLPIDEETFKNDLKSLIKENISLAKFHQITIERAVNKEFSRYGFPTVSISGDNNSTINIGKYTAFENNMRERSKGKIDTNPSNAKTFFSYDIHEIYHIIEKGLEIKLSTEAKNDIESIVRMETSNLINHLNISHGSSDIQNIIEQIEKYISSRMKDKSKSFKFTESNRYKLKEILKRFLNTRNNGQK